MFICGLGSAFLSVEKGEPAELGQLFASQKGNPASYILGSFIIKRLLNINPFSTSKKASRFYALA
jgi:hypothetical protein